MAGVTGDGTWCLITANRKTCTYYASSGCRAAAVRAGGGCVRNTERDLASGRQSEDESQDLLSELSELTIDQQANP